MRKQLVIFLFEISKNIYTKFFKKDHIAWQVSTEDLLQFPTETFGFHLGEFLQQNNFQLIPKVERHDAYHTLTNYGTRVEEEIGLQYLCMGNGKKMAIDSKCKNLMMNIKKDGLMNYGLVMKNN